ncbi:hypothetical protein B0H11DRAFT_2194403 [Mycena galericulata]|nr:hypothetical protein B0H11DRAFT_2194403 [Mycena galericulata]
MSDLQGVALPEGIEQASRRLIAPDTIERGVDPFTSVEGRFHVQTIDGRVLGLQSAEDGSPVTTYTTLLDPSEDVLWTLEKDDSDAEAFTLQNIGRKLYLAVLPDASVGSSVIATTKAQVFVRTRLESHPSAVRITPRGQKLALQAAEQGNTRQQVTLEEANTATPGWWNQFFVFNSSANIA